MPKPATQHIVTCLTQFSINTPDSINLIGFYGDLHNDSRAIVEGDIFCAIIGHDQDGRQYNEKAITQGAKLVLTECESITEHGDVAFASSDSKVAMVKFYQLNQHLFNLTKNYYQAPQDNMTVVGITGTNGKTTTSQLLAQMLSAYDEPCAVIGTNGSGPLDSLQPIENTTPGACELHQLFNHFNDEHSVHGKFSYVAMEVSSHALSQKRVQADLFDIAVFTNLSRDHLDYHGSMASYGEAKKQIFSADSNQVAVVNFDDEQAQKWLDSWPEQQSLWLYSREKTITTHKQFVMAKAIKHHGHGVSFTLVSHLGNTEIHSPLLGDFNIDNLLAAICVLLIQGIPLSELPNLVTQVNAIAGRMEATSAKNLATAVVDYAHTPDALEKALKACRQHCSGELYVVFGCGGDRDKGKRALMAQAAEQYADYLVVTNDNPRSEDAQLIANDIVAGFTNPDAEQITIILEREQAVLKTLNKAKLGDIVLLAGKGHEDYVIVAKYDEQGVVIGTQKLAYNERLVVKDFYQKYADLATLSNEATL
jgi:UDP-N-acetylmuramoyl-L-alanyl-D-glutamate--2,6-diaminopimelate ligase